MTKTSTALFFALLQNIDQKYSLEPPRPVGLMVFPQSMFKVVRNKKKTEDQWCCKRSPET